MVQRKREIGVKGVVPQFPMYSVGMYDVGSLSVEYSGAGGSLLIMVLLKQLGDASEKLILSFVSNPMWRRDGKRRHGYLRTARAPETRTAQPGVVGVLAASTGDGKAARRVLGCW